MEKLYGFKRLASAIALTFFLVLGSSVPAFAGHWAITYHGSGSGVDWGSSLSWPSPVQESGAGYTMYVSDDQVGSLSGDVHAVLKWIPSSVNDPAPSRIVVKEYGFASVGRVYPTIPNFDPKCDNGFGNPAGRVFESSGEYYDAQGIKMSSVTVPPANAQGETIVTLQSRHLSASATSGFVEVMCEVAYKVEVLNKAVTLYRTGARGEYTDKYGNTYGDTTYSWQYEKYIPLFHDTSWNTQTINAYYIGNWSLSGANPNVEWEWRGFDNTYGVNMHSLPYTVEVGQVMYNSSGEAYGNQTGHKTITIAYQTIDRMNGDLAHPSYLLTLHDQWEHLKEVERKQEVIRHTFNPGWFNDQGDRDIVITWTLTTQLP